MTVTSFWFFVFLIVGVVIYYAIPRFQWVVLLLLSIIFYFVSAVQYTFVFPIASAAIAFVYTKMYRRYQGDEKREKVLLYSTILAVGLNVLLWFLLKGSSFWIAGSKVIRLFIPQIPVLTAFPILGAMGMAYYTSQVIGYILDIHWGNSRGQENFFKLLLFVVFFPQMTVGPISRYGQLECLYERHCFKYQNLCFGAQRILWGVFKKIVVSDRLGILISAIWEGNYIGIYPWVAVMLFPLQLYTDFSGCMDIVLGGAELFDIRLSENFYNPFFSRNCQEFWQRWHITLGAWAKDYIYYPLLKSRSLQKMGKAVKKKFGKKAGKYTTWTVGMFILWLTIGVWHGGVQHIFGVSLWFFLIIVLSELLEPCFEKTNRTLGINTGSFSWHLFQSIRTYFIYAMGAVFFSAKSLGDAFNRFKILFASILKPNIWLFFGDSTFELNGLIRTDLKMICIGLVLLLIVAMIREKYGYVRIWMKKQVLVFRWFVWLALFVLTLIFGLYGPGYDGSIFFYEGF